MGLRRLVRVGGALPSWARIAWWGLVAPRVERAPLVVHQAVVERGGEVLLGLRSDLRGWELPGGAAGPGESGEAALRREVREETGLEVEIVERVGDYERSGFRPHTARIYRCRPVGGTLRSSGETLRVRWFPADDLPDTLFPWYRAPLADARAARGAPLLRREHWGLRQVLAGLWIDLRVRASRDGAG
jgi:8-oxo-dGTP pyrophosphatase MutT (NUDIX family)